MPKTNMINANDYKNNITSLENFTLFADKQLCERIIVDWLREIDTKSSVSTAFRFLKDNCNVVYFKISDAFVSRGAMRVIKFVVGHNYHRKKNRIVKTHCTQSSQHAIKRDLGISCLLQDVNK